MAKRPSHAEVEAAESLLAAMEAAPTRRTTHGLGAYHEAWLASKGLSPGDHAEIVALRVLLADREARIRDMGGARGAVAWSNALPPGMDDVPAA